MKRNSLNFLVDLVSGLVVIGLTATGLMLRFVLPPGSGRAKALWAFSRHDWGDVHFWLAISAAGLLLVHLALHWQWICVTALRLLRRDRGEQTYPGGLRRNLAGAALVLSLAGLFAGFVLFAQASVTSTGQGGEHRGRGESAQLVHDQGASEQEHASIRGYMTLDEVAEANGVPVEELRKKLNLPADLSPDERLGRLRQRYGFTMDQVRQIVVAQQGNDAYRPPR